MGRAAVLVAVFVIACSGSGGRAPVTPAADAAGPDAADARDSSGEAAELPAGEGDASVDGWTRPPLPPARDHREAPLYFSSDRGTFELRLGDRRLRPFGVQAATRALAASPSGALVAQETAGEIVVFGRDGRRLARFASRGGLLGWSDERTLILHDRSGTAALVRVRWDGAERRALPNPDPLPAISIRAASLSPEGALAAVVMETVASAPIGTADEVFIVRTDDGAIVRRLGRLPEARFGLLWTIDDRLVGLGDLGADAGQVLLVVAPDTGVTSRVTLSFSACSLGPWLPVGTVLLGQRISQQDTVVCAGYSRVTIEGATAQPLPWLQGAGSTNGGPRVALAPDAQKLIVATSQQGLMIVDAAGAAPEPLIDGPAGAVTAIAWGAAPLAGEPTLSPADAAPPAEVVLPPALPDPIPPRASRTGTGACTAGRWVDRTPVPLPASWPSLRSSFAAAFDSSRGVLLVHGGRPANQAQEMMEWHGGRGGWVNRTIFDGFGPRVGHVMSHDSKRAVTLGFGGMARINGDDLGDGPWSWSSVTGVWNSLGVPGPDGRVGAAAVFDRARDRWLLVGGSIRVDTWEWDPALAVWERRSQAAPQSSVQLVGHSVIYDGKRAQVLLLGNRDMGRDVWAWDGGAGLWTRRPTDGPSPLPRESMQVAYDEHRDRVMLFGGYTVGGGISTNGDLWEWDPATHRFTDCTAGGARPPARFGGAMVHDPARGTLVLYGGETFEGDSRTFHDLWEWYLP